MTRALYLLLAIALLGGTAHADPALTVAKRHYERGQKLFGLQKFQEALEQYQRAFEAKPLPDFLFNIGQCQRNLGDYDAAIFSFKRYLKLAPDAENRERVEALIAELEDRRAAEDARRLRLQPPPREPDPAPARPAPEPIAPPVAHRPIYKRWWFWTGIAVAGAAGGVGIYAATSGGPPDTSLGRNIVFGR